MGSDIVHERLCDIQYQYKTLLINLRDNFDKSSSNVIFDEVNVFWFKNRSLVDLIFKCYFEPYTSYLFLAAGYLDINDNEHFPFLSIGKNHVLDDPICKLMLLPQNMEKSPFADELKQHTFDAICDNINVLERCFDIIYILPCSLFYRGDRDSIVKGAESAFLSMLQNEISLKDYFQSINTIDDIRGALRPGIEKAIFLLEDDYSEDFGQRFLHYKEERNYPAQIGSSDGKIFFFAMSGYLTQALDILLVSLEYKAIPYIRFEIALKNAVLLAQNFKEVPELKDILYKAITAHVLHMVFDKRLIEDMGLQEYLEKIRKSDFEKNIYEKIKTQENSESLPMFNAVAQIIYEELPAALS